LSDAVELVHGWTHVCARLHDGSARCWGGSREALGNRGAQIASKTPVGSTRSRHRRRR
jgi:hypothetical protein